MFIRLVSFCHTKARSWVRGRRDWYKKLVVECKSRKGSLIWFHCASLGEFEQGRAVMELFKRLHPNWQLVVTFFSPSGYEVRKDYPLADFVLYLPLDTPSNARRFIDTLQPTIAVFVKYEFWYFYLRELRRRGIAVHLISALFRPEQLFFKSYGMGYRSWLQLFNTLMVQDVQSSELLARFGIAQQVAVVGDSRFDRVYEAAQQPRSVEKVEIFAANVSVFVAGSTWPADEERLLPIFRELPKGWKAILVPHEIHEQNIVHWLHLFSAEEIVRYTAETTLEHLQKARIMIVDSVGLLLAIYRYASLVYVGGGFGVGIHNTLEPATFSLPITFGPHFTAFREALDLIDRGAALTLETQEDFREELLQLMHDTALRAKMGSIARDYVLANIGASQRIIKLLERSIE